MFIARGIHQIHPSPRGATYHTGIREELFNARTAKRQRPKETLMHLAPEGRHVYSTRHTQNTQSPRGATGDSVIRKGNLTQARKDATHADRKTEG